jgi:hypothetical protein
MLRTTGFYIAPHHCWYYSCIAYQCTAVDTALYCPFVYRLRTCRTFDPEEADYFYVPQYSVCYIFPIRGWADFPWFSVPEAGEWLGSWLLDKWLRLWL